MMRTYVLILSFDSQRTVYFGQKHIISNYLNIISNYVHIIVIIMPFMSPLLPTAYLRQKYMITIMRGQN